MGMMLQGRCIQAMSEPKTESTCAAEVGGEVREAFVRLDEFYAPKPKRKAITVPKGPAKRYLCERCGEQLPHGEKLRHHHSVHETLKWTCKHMKSKSACGICKDVDFCEHSVHPEICSICNQDPVCEHGCERVACVPCNSTEMCEHRHPRTSCEFAACHRLLESDRLAECPFDDCNNVVVLETNSANGCLSCRSSKRVEPCWREHMTRELGSAAPEWASGKEAKIFTPEGRKNYVQFDQRAVSNNGGHVVYAEVDEDWHPMFRGKASSYSPETEVERIEEAQHVEKVPVVCARHGVPRKVMWNRDVAQPDRSLGVACGVQARVQEALRSVSTDFLLQLMKERALIKGGTSSGKVALVYVGYPEEDPNVQHALQHDDVDVLAILPDHPCAEVDEFCQVLEREQCGVGGADSLLRAGSLRSFWRTVGDVLDSVEEISWRGGSVCDVGEAERVQLMFLEKVREAWGSLEQEGWSASVVSGWKLPVVRREKSLKRRVPE